MKAKRTKPYTNQEFFTELCARVDLPKILDYTLADSKAVEIKSYECSFWKLSRLVHSKHLKIVRKPCGKWQDCLQILPIPHSTS